MNRFTILILFGLIQTVKAQKLDTIDVADLSLKVPAISEEFLYYGFETGDKVIFNYAEKDGDKLKELEILEYPSTPKFSEYKTNKIVNKVLNINKRVILKFRFNNGHVFSARVCKIKIQRIAAHDTTKNFNTNIIWNEISDTVHYIEQEKYIVKSDTTFETLIDQISKVSSRGALNGNTNKTIVDFTLPQNTISWSYYIGVGQEGKAAYKAAEAKFLQTAGKQFVKYMGLGPMGLLALNGVSLFNAVQGADNVHYWFLSDWNSVLLLQAGQPFTQYKQGNVVNDASQMRYVPNDYKVYLGLMNDNLIEPIEVLVKVNAVVVNSEWNTRPVNRMKISTNKLPFHSK